MSAAAFFGLCLAMSGASAAPKVEPTAAERARSILARIADPSVDPPLDLGSAVAQLSMLGAGAIPAYVTVWSTRTSRPERHDAVVRALLELPRNTIGAELRSIASSAPSPERRTAATRLLAEIRHSEAVLAWMDLAHGLQTNGLLGSQYEADAAEVLGALLRARPEDHALLASRVPKLTREVLSVVVSGTELASVAEGIDLVERIASRHRDLEPICVPALGRLCELHPGPEAEHALDVVRTQLTSREPVRRERAALALGRALDARSALHFVELLSDVEPLVAHAAQDGLHRISGHRWRAEPERWLAWLDGEETWRRERLHAVIDAARGPQVTIALRALEELARHPLHAHEIAQRLGDDVAFVSTPQAPAAVSVLRDLGSRAAIPFLHACADEAESAAADAALRVLHTWDSRSED